MVFRTTDHQTERTEHTRKSSSTHFLALFAYYDSTMNIEVAVASYLCDGVVLFASLPHPLSGRREIYEHRGEDFRHKWVIYVAIVYS